MFHLKMSPLSIPPHPPPPTHVLCWCAAAVIPILGRPDHYRLWSAVPERRNYVGTKSPWPPWHEDKDSAAGGPHPLTSPYGSDKTVTMVTTKGTRWGGVVPPASVYPQDLSICPSLQIKMSTIIADYQPEVCGATFALCFLSVLTQDTNNASYRVNDVVLLSSSCVLVSNKVSDLYVCLGLWGATWSFRHGSRTCELPLRRALI